MAHIYKRNDSSLVEINHRTNECNERLRDISVDQKGVCAMRASGWRRHGGNLLKWNATQADDDVDEGGGGGGGEIA